MIHKLPKPKGTAQGHSPRARVVKSLSTPLWFICFILHSDWSFLLLVKLQGGFHCKQGMLLENMQISLHCKQSTL